MKNIVRFCLLILGVVFYSCNDPYEDTTYKVYDMQPAATYLQERSEDFSEWVKMLKYGDLFNAINRADDAFTVLAPTNEAVYRFYEKKKVTSYEDLDRDYVRTLVQYHIINDSISQEDFVKGGELPARTLSGDALQVTFDEESGGEESLAPVFINKEARVKEFAIKAINGRIYVLNDVLNPAVETIYEHLSATGEYTIFCEALEKTGWSDTLNIKTFVHYGPMGMKVETRRYFTVLAVSDKTFAGDGISSFSSLLQEINVEGTNYESLENELNRYIAYHIMDGAYKMEQFQSYDKLDINQKIWYTRSGVDMILASTDGFNSEATIDVENADLWVRNGFIHSINHYLPVKEVSSPVPFVFDFCNYPELNSYINDKGKGQLFQQLSKVDKGESTALTKFIGRKEIVPQVSCYQLEVGPSGTRSDWDYIEYATVGSSGGAWLDELNRDHLVINIGYNGTLTMPVPPILAGKYKITLFLAYDPQQAFIGKRDEDSQGGLCRFYFDDDSENKSALKRVYDTKKDDVAGYFSIELYEEKEFTETTSHQFKMVVLDPAASSHAQFRMYFDYLLFEPIN